MRTQAGHTSPPESAILLDLPPYITDRKDGVCIAIKVQPRASRNAIGEVLGKELKVKVTAPPVDSAANEAVLEFLAKRLGRPRGSVMLVRGYTSPHKWVLIHGLPAAQILKKLQA